MLGWVHNALTYGLLLTLAKATGMSRRVLTVAINVRLVVGVANPACVC
jgi:hypothetical protein